MDIGARPPIGCADPHLLEGRKGGVIAQAIPARALERGSARAISAVDVRGGQLPRGMLGDMRPQTVALLVNRLGLLLAAGRPAGIPSDFHGGSACELVLAQAGCLGRLPAPSASGTGRHTPPVAHRQCGQLRFGSPAKNGLPSWYPPAPGRTIPPKDTRSVRTTAGAARAVATTRGGACPGTCSRRCHV